MQRKAHRRLQEADAARMARRVPRVGRALRMVRQRLEERRQQLVHVVLGGPHDLPREERHRVFVDVQDAVQVAQALHRLGRLARERRGLAQRDDGQARRALVHRVHQVDDALRHLRVIVRRPDRKHDRGQPAMRAGDDARIGLVVDQDRLPAGFLQLALDLAQAHARHALRRDVAVRDQDRESRLELHGAAPVVACVVRTRPWSRTGSGSRPARDPSLFSRRPQMNSPPIMTFCAIEYSRLTDAVAALVEGASQAVRRCCSGGARCSRWNWSTCRSRLWP